jgi:putative inorganic carbon (HCO3(-)) transporter
MRRNANLWTKVILAVLVSYAVLGGATMNAGMLNPRYEAANLILIGALTLGWVYIRQRRHWKWYSTPLEYVILLWVFAIGLSLAANTDLWRRIAIGSWYAGLYILLWYIVQDALANRALSRETLADGLLWGGALVMLIASSQLWNLGTLFLSLPGDARSGVGPLSDVVRVAGTLDNPNRLATLLVVLIPLALGRLIAAPSRLARLIWAAYSLLAAVLVIFTFSRGGWVGLAAGLAVFGLLLVMHYRLFSPARLRDWWHKQSRAVKGALAGLGAAAVIGALVGGVILVSISLTGTRAADQRGTMYQAAITLFTEKPLTGYGLFTYGRGLVRLDSMPPRQVHSHAHDVPLTIAAELGLVGLIVFLVSGVAIFRAARRRWLAATGNERLMLAGAIAGLVGFSVHHLSDYTALMALIAIYGLLLLAVVVAPSPAAPRVPAKQWRLLIPVGLALALLVTGFVSNAAYANYVSAILYGVSTPDAPGTAQRLQTAIDGDPAMPIYHLMRAYFLGTAAQSGDQTAARQGIDEYKQFCSMEPYYAPAWANLSALYWQTGDRDQAIAAMTHASSIAPDDWEIAYNLGLYQEMQGQLEAARQSYEHALRNYPASRLYPAWQESDLRRSIASTYDPHKTIAPFTQAVSWLDQGAADKAQAALAQLEPGDRASAYGRALTLILAVEAGQREAIDPLLTTMRNQSKLTEPLYQALGWNSYPEWVHLGAAYAAWFKNDLDTARQEIKTTKALMPVDPSGVADIASSQFLRIGIAQYLLPQLYAPAIGPEFANLLNRIEQRVSANALF